MRSSVYLFAAAILAATPTLAIANDMMAIDSPVVAYGETVYETTYGDGDTYAETAYETAYGDTYASAQEVMYVEDVTPMDVQFVELPADTLTYASEIDEESYPVASFDDTPMTTTETIDGIVYETMIETPRTY